MKDVQYNNTQLAEAIETIFGLTLEDIQNQIQEYRAAFNEYPKTILFPQPKNLELFGCEVLVKQKDKYDEDKLEVTSWSKEEYNNGFEDERID